jgi:hypothetical protein
MSAIGSVAGTASETPTMEELIEAVKKLEIAQKATKSDVKEIKEKDGEVKESQRKLAKLPIPPRFRGNLPDLDGWIL